MNWLDVALAGPIIGIACEPRLQFPHEMINATRPIIEKWKQKFPQILVAIPGQGALINIRVGDGFQCDILGNAINTIFSYEQKVVEKPAALPTVSYPNLKPFSELLPVAIEYVADLCDALSDPPIELTRLGIVADCRLDGDALPPGIIKFLDHVGKPWGAKPLICAGTFSYALASDDENWNFRCNHGLDVNSIDRPGDVRLRLDWQMLPRVGKHSLPKRSARKLIADAAKRANDYFETFGSGDLKYGIAD